MQAGSRRTVTDVLVGKKAHERGRHSVGDKHVIEADAVRTAGTHAQCLAAAPVIDNGVARTRHEAIQRWRPLLCRLIDNGDNRVRRGSVMPVQ